jgi:hypothetical protein
MQRLMGKIHFIKLWLPNTSCSIFFSGIGMEAIVVFLFFSFLSYIYISQLFSSFFHVCLLNKHIYLEETRRNFSFKYFLSSLTTASVSRMFIDSTEILLLLLLLSSLYVNQFFNLHFMLITETSE